MFDVIYIFFINKKVAKKSYFLKKLNNFDSLMIYTMLIMSPLVFSIDLFCE